MSLPTLIGTSSYTDFFPYTGTLVLAAPAGLAQGDTLLASILVTGNPDPPVAVTGPAGWAKQRDDVVGAGNQALVFRHQVWSYTAGASEPSSYTWTPTSAAYFEAGAVLGAWRGAKLGNIAATTHLASDAAPTGLVAPSINVTAQSTLACFFSFRRDPGGHLTVATATGMTRDVFNDGGSGTGFDIELDEQTLLAAGATGTRAAPYLYDGSPSNSVQIASIGVSVELVAVSSPIVAISAPAVASSPVGGPTITVTWAYSNDLGYVENRYRVRLMNVAGTTTYSDTGFLAGAAVSKTLDLLALGVPTDTTDISVRVDVEATDLVQAFDVHAFNVLWGVVTTTITAPTTGTQLTTSAPPAVVWTFASTRGKAQGFYRVRISFESGANFYDTGWVAGAVLTHTPPNTVLPDGSRLLIGVQTKNVEGVLS